MSNRRRKLWDVVSEEVIESESVTNDPTKSVDSEQTELIVENCGLLNMRVRPSTEAKVVLLIRKGTRVILVGEAQEGWVQVRTKDSKPVTGYVMTYFLGQV